MKTTLLLLFVSLCAFSSKAQDWQTYIETDQVLISYKLIEIDDQKDGIHHERIVFRYENRTAENIQMSFNRSIIYSDTDESKPQEKTYSVSIPANSSVEYNDANAKDKTYYLFANDKKKTIKTTLVNFDIKNVIIN